MDSPSTTPPKNEQPPPPGVKSPMEFTDIMVSSSIPKSILGAEQAKKRLQAFCIQKKQKLEPQDLKVLNKIKENKTNTLKSSSLDNDKSKAGTSKKSSKMNEYERSKLILSNIMEFKEEEERKLALIRLGVPLGLVPGGVIGLKQQSMPTKAMPPIQKLLNPKDVERIISQAAKGDGDFNFKVSINELTKPGNKKDNLRHIGSNNSRNHSRNDRDRRNNRQMDRHQRYDSKRDRNDRDRRRNRNDSHSSRYRDYNKSKERKKSDSKDMKDTGNKPTVKYLDLGKKSKVGEYVIASLYGSGNVNQMHQIKDEEKKDTNSIKTFDKSEIVAQAEVDCEVKDKVDDDENVFDIENEEATSSIEVVKEVDIVQDSNKFIRNSFVPIFSYEDTTIKSCSEEDINEFILEDPAIEAVSKATVDNNLAVISDEFTDLYSPNVGSSNGEDDERSQTPIINEMSFVEKEVEEPVPDLVCDMEENSEEFYTEPENKNQIVAEDKTEEVSTLWTDISQICNPNMHFSSECYRQTFNQPIINYCENLNNCDCHEAKRKNMEKLSSNVDKIKDQLLVSDVYDSEISSSKGWYPKTSDVFKTFSVDSLSNWESDDSETHEVQPNTKSNVDNLQKIMESKFDLKDTSNTESDNFSNLKKFTNEDAPIDADDLPKYMAKKFTLEDSPKMDTDKLPIFANKFLLEVADNLPKIEAKECIFEENSKMDVIVDEKETLYDKIELPFNIPNNLVQSPIINVSTVATLDSEYEKFMEAVWPEISESKMDQDQDRSQESFAESQISKSVSEISDDHVTKSNSVQMEEDDFCISETCKNELPVMSDEPNVNKQDDGVTQNLSKVNEEHWSGDSNMDDDKKPKKQIICVSPKPEQKRKGHAKISSRRKKGKHKKSKVKSDSGSSSSDDSKAESSSSSSSSTDSSSDDSSHSSKSSSSSSSDLSSFSDLFSTDSSDASSDESDSSNSKKKKKKKQLKKKYRRLSKSKQKKLRLIAKAKELARKMKLKKKKKKLKAKLAKDKSTSSEITDKKEQSQEKSSDSKKKKRKLSDDGKISKKNKKKKYSNSDESSDSSSKSYDSQSEKRKTKKRKNIKCSNDTDNEIDKAKKMKLESSDLQIKTEESLDVDTLKNIKREKVSDEEEIQHKSVQISKVTRAPYRQQIINASELQSDFLSVNKYQEVISAPVKTESPTRVNFSDMFNKCASETNRYNSLYDDEDDVGNKTEDSRINSEFNNNSNGHAEQTYVNEEENIPFIDEEMPRPIEKIECHWRPEPSKSISDRKASRWDDTNKDDSVSCHINNSSLIEVPIQSEIKSYNIQAITDSDNVVYKIPTISSRSDEQNYGDIESYNDYDVYSKHDEIEQETFKEVNTTPSRKISLDDRINMVLQFPGDILNNSIDRNNGSAKTPKMDVTPDKGILVGGNKVPRSDPRINRAKRVSFADGFLPGQDSDCENDINVVQQMNTSISANGTMKKKKKHKTSGGHAYPCPDSWPDYHTKWDKLPPPPPPPGSPPPDLCEKITNVPHFSININTPPLQTLLPNLVENLLVS